jgi:hypothetical protein
MSLPEDDPNMPPAAAPEVPATATGNLYPGDRPTKTHVLPAVGWASARHLRPKNVQTPVIGRRPMRTGKYRRAAVGNAAPILTIYFLRERVHELA